MIEDITGQEIKEKFKSNKKLRLIVFSVGGILLLLLGYFLYIQMIWNPANEKSKDSYWEGLVILQADSVDVDAALEEFRSAAKKYDGKIGGEVSQFLYARQLMAKGEYKKALEELEDVEVEDTYVRVLAVGLQADCISEMKNYSKASAKYEEAANMIDNDFTTPMYLNKAAGCAIELRDYKKVKEYYRRILKGYPTFASQNDTERHLARYSNMKLK